MPDYRELVAEADELRNQGSSEKAVELYLKAADAAMDAGERLAAIECHHQGGVAMSFDLDTANPFFVEALNLLGEDQDPKTRQVRGRILCDQAAAYINQCTLDGVRDPHAMVVERLLDDAHTQLADVDRSALAVALTRRAIWQLLGGQLADAQRSLGRASLIWVPARQRGEERFSFHLATLNLAWARLKLADGDPLSAECYLAEAMIYLGELGKGFSRRWAEHQLLSANAYCRLNNRALAQQNYEAGIELLPAAPEEAKLLKIICMVEETKKMLGITP